MGAIADLLPAGYKRLAPSSSARSSTIAVALIRCPSGGIRLSFMSGQTDVRAPRRSRGAGDVQGLLPLRLLGEQSI
jgi:hypothetical protein